MKKRILSFVLFCGIVLCAAVPFLMPAGALEFADAVSAKSAILMEASTGRVLYEYNADEALPPASVTKVMTMLLVLEAVDGGKITLDDPVTVSDYASSMGGSQVYLKAGEVMTVRDLLKSVVVASANDAAVALAEYVSGSEGTFVARMNERAAELGMKNTVFKNTNGLDDSDTGHVTSARDIAMMSREVLKHETIFDFSTIWMDSIRDGAFGLTNTNRLIRFYRGCNGLKTGSTSKAGFCISATAKRDGMQLICVVMASPNKDARNALAASLLDWGFSGYALASFPAESLEPLYVRSGETEFCPVSCASFSSVVDKGQEKNARREISLPETLRAPVKKGDTVGQVSYYSGDTLLGNADISADADIPALRFGTLLLRMLSCFTLK